MLEFQETEFYVCIMYSFHVLILNVIKISCSLLGRKVRLSDLKRKASYYLFTYLLIFFKHECTILIIYVESGLKMQISHLAASRIRFHELKLSSCSPDNGQRDDQRIETL